MQVDPQEALMHTYLNLSPSQNGGNAVVEMDVSRLAEQRHLLMAKSPSTALQTQPSNNPEMNIETWMQGVDYRLAQIETCITSLLQHTSNQNQGSVVSAGATTSSSALIRRRDLESVLGPLFCRHPIPNNIELSSVTRTLEHLYPHLERRPILSQVRKWFRKRREELGQKVFAQAQSRWGNERMDKAQVERVLSDLRRDRQALTQILVGCSMDLEVNDACLNLIHSKVESYLTRRKTGKAHVDSDDD